MATQPIPRADKNMEPSGEIGMAMPFALIMLGCLDFFILMNESSYLPFSRHPGSEDIVDFCLFIPIILLSIVISVFFRESNSLITRRRIRYSLYVALLLFLIAAPLIPFAYLLSSSRREFFQFEITKKFLPDSSPLPTGARALFVLLSDVHLTDQKRTLEHFPADKDRFLSVLRHAKLLEPKYCVLAGDLTDRGTEGEWHLFESVLSANVSLSERQSPKILLIPGNHDLQGAPAEGIETMGYVDPYQFELSFLERETRFYQQMRRWESQLQPVSASHYPGADFLNWLNALQLEKAKEKFDYSEMKVKIGSSEIGKDETVNIPIMTVVYPEGFGEVVKKTQRTFNALFPLVEEDPQDGLVLILMNSAAEVRPGASMGLGDLGDEQLSRLKTELDALKQNSRLHYVIVALHHAPVRHQADAWDWKQALRKRNNSDIFEHTFLALNLGNSKSFLSILDEFANARRDVEVAILHGHRHQQYLGRTASGIWIIESPALVENEDGFWVGYDDNGHLRVKWINGHK